MFLELAIVAGVRLSPTKVTLLGGFRGICGKIKTRLVTLLHVTCYNKVVPHVASVTPLPFYLALSHPDRLCSMAASGGVNSNE